MEKPQYKELMMPGTSQVAEPIQNGAGVGSIPVTTNQEQRGSRRKRALLSAVIKFNENFAAVKCVIRNISDHGALIKVTDTNAVPNHFTLQIPMQGIEVECQVIDQAGHQIRLEFTSEKGKLDSRKVQYIGATTNIPLQTGGDRQTIADTQSNGSAKNTNNLISNFRKKKFDTR